MERRFSTSIHKKSTKTNFKSVLVDINEQIGKLPFEPLNEQIKLAFVNAVHNHQISNRTDTEWTILEMKLVIYMSLKIEQLVEKQDSYG